MALRRTGPGRNGPGGISGSPLSAPPSLDLKGRLPIFADTFNRSFEPANLRAATAVLNAAGFGVAAFADDSGKPLCCGRTYYDTGHIEEARCEAERMTEAAAAFAERGVAIIGLEPNCVLMMRDEYASLGLARAENRRRFSCSKNLSPHASRRAISRLPLKPIEADVALHPHCHERVLGLESASEAVLKLIPQLAVSQAPPTCCGLNGVTGMTPDTLDASLAMAELALFPGAPQSGRRCVHRGDGLFLPQANP